MKVTNLFIFLFILTISFSCSVKRSSIKFKIKPRNILIGDTVKLSWNIPESKKILNIKLNDAIDNLDFKGDTNIVFTKDTIVNLKVFVKGVEKPLRKRRKITVTVPRLVSFTGYVDRFSPNKAIIEWKFENVETVRIRGFQQEFKAEDQLTITNSKIK